MGDQSSQHPRDGRGWIYHDLHPLHHPTRAHHALSTDSSLRDLVVQGQVLDPRFAADQLVYTVDVDQAPFITVVATANDPAARVAYRLADVTDADGHIPLLVGVNEVSVVVTAEDGSFTVYALTVTRQTAALVPVDPPPLLNFRTNLAVGTGSNDPIEFSVVSREEFQAAVVTARNYGPIGPTPGGRATGPDSSGPFAFSLGQWTDQFGELQYVNHVTVEAETTAGITSGQMRATIRIWDQNQGFGEDLDALSWTARIDADYFITGATFEVTAEDGTVELIKLSRFADRSSEDRSDLPYADRYIQREGVYIFTGGGFGDVAALRIYRPSRGHLHGNDLVQLDFVAPDDAPYTDFIATLSGETARRIARH